MNDKFLCLTLLCRDNTDVAVLSETFYQPGKSPNRNLCLLKQRKRKRMMISYLTQVFRSVGVTKCSLEKDLTRESRRGREGVVRNGGGPCAGDLNLNSLGYKDLASFRSP